jgi:hypothetical protein
METHITKRTTTIYTILIDAKPEDNKYLFRVTENHKTTSIPFFRCATQHPSCHLAGKKKKKVSWLDTNKCTCGYPESKM